MERIEIDTGKLLGFRLLGKDGAPAQTADATLGAAGGVKLGAKLGAKVGGKTV